MPQGVGHRNLVAAGIVAVDRRIAEPEFVIVVTSLRELYGSSCSFPFESVTPMTLPRPS